jgi:hypothetical protein
MALHQCGTQDFWDKFDQHLNVALDRKFDEKFDLKLREYDVNTAQVRDNQIHSTLAEQKSELLDINVKIDDLNKKLTSIERIDNFASAETAAIEQKAIRETITSQSDRYLSFEHSYSNFVKYQLLQNSIREQRSRDWSCRIVNYQQPWSRENINEYAIFRHLIHPVLEVSLKRGQIEHLPDRYQDIIDKGHMLPFNKGQIPTFIFRFTNRHFLDAFQDNKKDLVDRFNADIKRYNPRENVSPVTFYPGRVVQVKQDVTNLNRMTLTLVYGSGLVSRAKVQGQHVNFQLKTGSPWLKVLNPFGQTLKEMTLPIPGSENFFLSDVPPILQYHKLSPDERRTFFSDSVVLTEQDFPRQSRYPPSMDNAEFPPIVTTGPAPNSHTAAPAATTHTGPALTHITSTTSPAVPPAAITTLTAALSGSVTAPVGLTLSSVTPITSATITPTAVLSGSASAPVGLTMSSVTSATSAYSALQPNTFSAVPAVPIIAGSAPLTALHPVPNTAPPVVVPAVSTQAGFAPPAILHPAFNTAPPVVVPAASTLAGSAPQAVLHPAFNTAPPVIGSAQPVVLPPAISSSTAPPGTSATRAVIAEQAVTNATANNSAPDSPESESDSVSTRAKAAAAAKDAVKDATKETKDKTKRTNKSVK